MDKIESDQHTFKGLYCKYCGKPINKFTYYKDSKLIIFECGNCNRVQEDTTFTDLSEEEQAFLTDTITLEGI